MEHPSHRLPFRSSSQAQWAKAANAVADLVLIAGKRAINVMKAMEQGGTVIGAGTFRPLETLYDPADFESVLGQLELVKKPTTAKVKEVVASVAAARWWEWALLHPELGPDRVHPSRSVLRSFPVPDDAHGCRGSAVHWE